ncbi:DNA/RNA non-specific endonuclease [Caminibacter mediatlanticus]|uniref:DNA/RNA non-specific endonuclease n=1 Tax=Caminibacter mediatlanticus TB-2 TaxID=391592 RepID=A0AAI9AH90_9BACT|nr:DNA/RNA non-specific endonuclease [Caminibacter mediatlanticus]EDM23575.1 DNA/RNA non-specific endonuclease [Caminibacter mediatlanticus TB-2]
MKKLLLLIPFILFAFTSKYLSNYNINVKCDKILHKKAFDICYSCKWKTPKLVVYKVNETLIDKYNLSRKHLRFRHDYNLPYKCRSYSKDYSKTGYDKGHLAPNAVFDYNRAIQKETVLMSNIAPQKPQLNRKLWAKIEKFVRIQARKYGKVKVITGVCGSLGHIKNSVNIPKWWYKIIFRPDGKVISFLVPNSNKVGKDKAKKYLSSLKEIERVCDIEIKEKK